MKKQTLPFFLCLLIFLISKSIFAAYLRNVPVKITQPDGQIVSCFASGDEFYNWLHDERNFTIIKNPNNGFYVFAVIEDGKLAPSEFIVGTDDPQNSGMEPGINVYPEKSLLKSTELQTKSSYISTGELNNIVIFIRFADQSEYITPVSDYQNIFNGNDFSLYDYFKEVSGNQLSISSTFYPIPHEGWVLSYQDPYNRNYYQAYDATTNPYGYSNDDELVEREHTLLQNAVKFVKPAIEASGLNFDADQDGYVDNICFIIQGNVEGWSDLLWPHRWALYLKEVFINNARVWDYNFQLSESTNVSVLCHEMFHTLGAPDLYHYSHDGLNPVGGWDLMAWDNAQHTTTWMKYKYGNWFSTIPEMTSSGSYKLPAVSVNPFACYKIPVPESDSEFFMVEYRKKTGYDSNLYYSYDEGLLVYRVNPEITGNRNGPPDEIYMIRPGIDENSENGFLENATFSDVENRSELSSFSDPYPFLENGTKNSFSIYDVKLTGDSIEFKFYTGEHIFANFSTSKTNVNAGEKVNFTDLSTGSPTSWLWSFGDGELSTEQNPEHYYLIPGVYSVELIISDDFHSDTIFKENYITVFPPPDCPSYFQSVWNGNGFDQMNINILVAQLDGMDLQPGDEIGVFDGDLCVGFGKVAQTVSLDNVLVVVVSRDDGTGNGFTTGNNITYKLWDCSASAEFPVQSTLYFNNMLQPVDEPTFNAGATAFVELYGTSQTEISMDLHFNSGWNLFSAPVHSKTSDMKTLFQPLIDNTSLVKIQDEQGNAMEDWGFLGGWKNLIGNIQTTEGYKIRVTFDETLEVNGEPVEYPFAIPLSSGWNIMGYPKTTPFDAMEILQPLINKGALQKVQDEAGNAIENWGFLGGWKNLIGEFVPGEGYKIKLAVADTVWIQESYPKSVASLPQEVATSHFRPKYENNGLDHMNLNISELPISLLQSGDELAVFDGNICVGAVTLLPLHLNSGTVSVPASAADDFGMPGFTEGNEFTLKLWSTKQQQEFELEPEILKGPGFFIKHESSFLSLGKYATTKLDVELLSAKTEVNYYPNPFSDDITIEINLAEDAEVQIEVLNQLGQRIQMVTNKLLLQNGRNKFSWDGINYANQQVSSGIYYLRIVLANEIIIKKLIYSK
ncbi:M6 family metalloprotease domain-containing protein [Mariniphaga sp.]|uniref:M6 family metalloprotease domain-containing protein n=1 Tax=Mariniphaga sp. TaxID=1954475 RepID=UPI003567E425